MGARGGDARAASPHVPPDLRLQGPAVCLYSPTPRRLPPSPFEERSEIMKAIKKNLALAALAALLAVPAAQTVFAQDKQAEKHETEVPKIPVDPNANQLSPEEKAAGWKLLFNGKDTEGWHSFRRQDVRP